MPRSDDSLVSRLDRLGVARLAEAAGLERELAERVAQVVVGSGLPEDRRVEVYRELVAHFQDGLAAGRTPSELLRSFGDAGRAARLVGRAKRTVTPEALGGKGRGEGLGGRVLRDVRYALRRLALRPAFTATAILSLAIGIGANTAMFTLVNELIFRRPPVRAPEELTEVYLSQADFRYNAFTYPDLDDLTRGTTDVFAAVGGSKLVLGVRETGTESEPLMGEAVTPNYFEMLGLAASRGRLFSAADAPAPGAGAVAVLSDGYWRRAFGADPAVVGQNVRLSGHSYTVIGVMRRDFPGSIPGIATAFFVPMTMLRAVEPSIVDPLSSRSGHSIFVKARLRSGVMLEQARVSVSRVAADLRERFPDDWRPSDTITLLPASDVILYPPVDRILGPVAALLLVVVGLVLLIACANLAGFLLARAVDRRKEIAVRLSLGASRARLVSQLLTETILLAVLGGALGTALGRLVLRAAVAVPLPLPIQLGFELPLDGRVLAFSIAVAVGAGVVFGLAPALQSTRFDLASVIRLESTVGGRSRNRLRGTLVAGQVAVAVVLLVAAGLFVRSLGAVRAVDPGFGKDPTAVALLGIPVDRGAAGILRTTEEIERRVALLPGVRAVGAISNLHLGMVSLTVAELAVDGVEPPPGERFHLVDRAAIDTGFIAAAGLRLIEGRNFAARDDSAAAAVAIVNQAFADRYFARQSPIGQRVHRANGTQVEVVGMVNTVRTRTIAEEPRPFIYFPLPQAPTEQIWLVAQAERDAEGVLEQMSRVIKDTNPDIFAVQRRTLTRLFAAQTLPFRLGVALLGAFAGLALLLASIGLYGMVSYAVAQRTREVGIRLSLGADRRSVVRLLLRDGLGLVLAGAIAGIVVALVLARLLEGLLYGVQALDPLTFVAVPAVLLLVALVAAYLPARRAGRVDPITALRTE